MNDYVVIVRFAEEAVSLSANSESEAIARVREIIAEEYTNATAEHATYEMGEL